MKNDFRNKLFDMLLICMTSCILSVSICLSSETEVLIDKLVEKGYLNSTDSQEIRNEISTIKQKEEQKRKEEEEQKEKKEKQKMEVSGYTQIMFVTDQSSNYEPLSIKRARISFSKTLNEWASFKIQPDFASIASATGGGSVAFREVWVKLIPQKDFAVFLIGQYHQPFGFENTFSSSKKKVADTPFYMNKILTTDYDYGIQWWGNLSGVNKNLFSWRVGIMNGTGCGTEDNRRKDISARILTSPIKDIEIGFSAYERNIYISTSVMHYGGYLKIETKNPFPIFFVGEYVGGKDSKGTKNVSNIITTLEINPFGKDSKVAPVIRYEHWDPDDNKTDDEITNNTFGLNFYLDKSVRILADYTIKTEIPSKKNDKFNIMLQVSY